MAQSAELEGEIVGVRARGQVWQARAFWCADGQRWQVLVLHCAPDWARGIVGAASTLVAAIADLEACLERTAGVE